MRRREKAGEKKMDVPMHSQEAQKSWTHIEEHAGKKEGPVEN